MYGARDASLAHCLNKVTSDVVALSLQPQASAPPQPQPTLQGPGQTNNECNFKHICQDHRHLDSQLPVGHTSLKLRVFGLSQAPCTHCPSLAAASAAAAWLQNSRNSGEVRLSLPAGVPAQSSLGSLCLFHCPGSSWITTFLMRRWRCQTSAHKTDQGGAGSVCLTGTHALSSGNQPAVCVCCTHAHTAPSSLSPTNQPHTTPPTLPMHSSLPTSNARTQVHTLCDSHTQPW